MAALTRSSEAPGLVRSPAKTAVSPSISCEACSATSPSRSLISTLAPSLTNSSAVALPMPRAEPVMIALFPSRIPNVVASSGFGAGDSYPSPCGAVELPEAVGGDPMGDARALGVGDAHLAEAEAPAALGDLGLGAQVDAARCGRVVDRQGDSGSRRILGNLVRCPGGRHRRRVDQRPDRAAVDDVADRRQLRLEGELENRFVRPE